MPSAIWYPTSARGDNLYIGFTPYGVQISHLAGLLLLFERFLGYDGRPGYGAYKPGYGAYLASLDMAHTWRIQDTVSTSTSNTYNPWAAGGSCDLSHFSLKEPVDRRFDRRYEGD